MVAAVALFYADSLKGRLLLDLVGTGKRFASRQIALPRKASSRLQGSRSRPLLPSEMSSKSSGPLSNASPFTAFAAAKPLQS